MGVTMTYGSYSFSPVPMVTLSKTFQKNAAGIAVGTLFNLNLNGHIIETGTGGIQYIFKDIRNIRNAFNKDGRYFKITDCTGGIILECFPRIIGEIQFSPSPDNMVYTAPFQINLEFDLEPVDINIIGSGENVPELMPGYISNYSDTYTYEFDDSISKYSLDTSAGTDTNAPILRATREVSAQGKSHYDGPGLTGTLTKPAWQWAKDFVANKLSASIINTLGSGIINLDLSNYTAYNHFRSQRIDEAGGTFSVTETYVINSGNIIEDFQVEINDQLEQPYTNVVINGTINGLESRSYGTNSGDFAISSTKFDNALAYYNSIADTALIFPRAQAVAADVTLNNEPLIKTVGQSLTKGTITYNYTYNNRPSNCITGAKTENIQIQDENPLDVFARISIMGRSQGPILQSFNTVTDFKRTVSIDAIMSPPTGCNISTLLSGNNPSSQVSSILCNFENDLKNRYSQVYKERDSENWEPKTGRFNRVISWAAVDCNTAPAISPCSGAN